MIEIEDSMEQFMFEIGTEPDFESLRAELSASIYIKTIVITI